MLVGLSDDKIVVLTDALQNIGSKSGSYKFEKLPKLDSHGDLTLNKNGGDQHTRKSPPGTPVYKKRHRGCSYCLLDVENAPLPESPSNQEVVGVISMEDVIEELLQVNSSFFLVFFL